MKSLHNHYNITVSDKFYDEFCGMTTSEKREVLEGIHTFDHLGKKEKDAEIKKIINGTPNVTRTRKKTEKADTASRGRGNAKSTAKRQRNDKAKD